MLRIFMSIKKFLLFILTASFLFAAEAFKLKDGSSILGERISEDENSIIVKTAYGEIEINKSDLIIKDYKVELKTGEKLIGIKIEENDLFIMLKTQAFGEVKINKEDILSIQELSKTSHSSQAIKPNTVVSGSSGMGLLGGGGVVGVASELIGGNDKELDFTEGEEQLIDLFLDPSAHTLSRSTLYMSGFSFGFGLTDNIQVTTRWNSFFWGDLNLRMKYKVFSKGNWKKQSTLAFGVDYHQRWATSDKFKWVDGSVTASDNNTYYYGGWIPVTSKLGDSQCGSDWISGNPDCDNDGRIDVSTDYDYMFEFFGAYTFSKARDNLKGQINQTIGLRATVSRTGENDTWEFFPRVYYGADFDLTPKFKVLVLGIYDEYMLEPYQLEDVPLFGFTEDLELSSVEVVKEQDVLPVHFDFGFVYALNKNFRFAIHFQRPWVGFYWKF